MASSNCRPSPSGKHHWWIYGEATNLQSYCKFCGRGGPKFKGVFDITAFERMQVMMPSIRRKD